MRQRNFFFFKTILLGNFCTWKRERKRVWILRDCHGMKWVAITVISLSFLFRSLFLLWTVFFEGKWNLLFHAQFFFSVRGSACLSWSRQNIFTRRYRPYAGTQKTAYQWWSSETTIPPSTRSDNNSVVRWSPSRLLTDYHCYCAMNLLGNLPLPLFTSISLDFPESVSRNGPLFRVNFSIKHQTKVLSNW